MVGSRVYYLETQKKPAHGNLVLNFGFLYCIIGPKYGQ